MITTPPYPPYAGNLATIGASAARALQHVCGNQRRPRGIYGGVHFRFDQEAGRDVGVSVADYVFANFVRPRGRWLD